MQKHSAQLTVVLAWVVFSASAAPDRISSLENHIVHATGGEKVYLIKSQKKHWILSPSWVTEHGYRWQDLKSLSAHELELIPSGDDITLGSEVTTQPSSLENQVVHSPEDPRVYLVKGGTRHWIPDPRWMHANGYSWHDLKSLSKRELQAIPIGHSLTFTPLMPPSTKVLICICTICGFLLLFLFVTAGPESGSIRVPGLLRGVLWLHNRYLAQAVLQGLPQARWLAFAVLICLILLRAPHLVLHPRFWAEEGTAWFQHAADHSFLSTLLYIYRPSGYLNLLANLAAIASAAAARLAGLEYAPMITTSVALAAHVACFVVLLFGKSRLFDSYPKVLAGCLIVLFSPTAGDEIWLNAINSISYLGLITFLLLFEDVSGWSVRRKWVVRCTLLLCGLSGPYSIMLWPLFGYVYFLYLERERLIHWVIMSTCLIIQTGTVLLVKLGSGLPGRVTEVALDASLVNILFFHVAAPALGYNGARAFLAFFGLTDAWMTASSLPRVRDSSLVLAAWASFAILAMVLLSLRGRGRDTKKTILICAFVILVVGIAIGSLNSIPSGRYAFLPGVVFLFLVLSRIEYEENKGASLACMVLLAFALSNGLATYRAFPGGPPWSHEVEHWRSNPDYGLRIWPAWWPERIRYRALQRPRGG